MLKPGFLRYAILFLLTSCTGKQTLFSKISASETGINFENKISESDSLNIFTFEYIYNGGGVGVGDFNNDGLQDLFFAGNMVSSKLYLNKGNFKFSDITEASGTGTKSWCTGVAMVDINEDGKLDIYVSTAFPSKDKIAANLLFINKGNDKQGVPRFEESGAKVGLNDYSYCSQSAFFDYDKDGDLDVYLCINTDKEADRNQLRVQRTDGSGLSQDKLYRNDGVKAGSFLPHFTDVSKQAGIQTEGWGLGLIVKDFNNDNWPDIYVANDYQSNDHLYINNKNGTFTNKISSYFAHQCHNAMGVDMADCNNDGLEDLCVVDMLPDENLRHKSMFGTIQNDKYAEALQRGYQPQFVRNMLQLNSGSVPDSAHAATFCDIGYMAGIAATDWSWTPLWADFDMDGWKDLLITNGYVKDITDLDFATYANENRMFGTSESNKKKLEEKAKELGEVKKSNFLFHNNRDLSFTDKAKEWGLSDVSFSNGAAYVDLDNDGDLDIVMNNLNDKAFVYRNNSAVKDSGKSSTGYSRLQIKLKGDKGNPFGIGAKISIWHKGTMQYAEQCLQRGYLSSVDDRLFFGLGKIEKIDSLKIAWQSGKVQILKNVRVNQWLLVQEKDAFFPVAPFFDTKSVLKPFKNAGNSLPQNYIHEENDYLDFNYQYTVPHKYSIQGPSLAVADVNGDALEDFYVSGSSRHSGYFFIQRKDGSFNQKALTKDVDNKLQEETGVLFFDADNDGDNDLYCVGGGNEFADPKAYSDIFYLNDGKGNFRSAAPLLPPTTGSGSCVVGADFDKDGDIDLFIGGRNIPHQYPRAGISYLLRNDFNPTTGQTKFTDATSQYCPAIRKCGMVTAALWTDYDNDGFLDLMITGEFMSLEIYRNIAGKMFKKILPANFKNYTGWYNSITGADFDNDGDADYVLGNLGLNSRFKANIKEPVTVRYRDFNDDGALDAFLFSYVNGVEYPVHTRNTMIDQIAALKKKIYYYHDFGKMGYKDIFNEADRQNATELEAFNMASIYVENKGSGKFKVSRLPKSAQCAPLNGIIAQDINQDGNLDIVAVGNFYGPESLTGRYDASTGWVLVGNGKGNFTSKKAAETGFFVPGDARALVKLNGGSRGTIVIAGRNKAPLCTFEKTSVNSLIPLKKDDSYALYTLRNGRKRKEEIYYGSSYLSQSGRFLEIGTEIKSVEIFNSYDKSRKLTF